MSYRELCESRMKAGQSVNITPIFVNLTDDEPVICGRFLSSCTVNSSVSDGTYNQYLFESDAGLVKFHLGSACDHEAGAVMSIGKIYHIEFLGKEKLDNTRSVNKYHIEEIPDE